MIGLGLPIMELVSVSATIAGTALAAFGPALIALDGFMALLAFVLTGDTAGLIVAQFYDSCAPLDPPGLAREVVLRLLIIQNNRAS